MPLPPRPLIVNRDAPDLDGVLRDFLSEEPGRVGALVRETEVRNLYIVQPAADPSQGPWDYVDIPEGSLISVAVGDPGAPGPYAFSDPTGWTAIENGAEITLPMSTAAMFARFAAVSGNQIALEFQIRITPPDSEPETILNVPVDVRRTVLDGIAPSPDAYTKAESDARYPSLAETPLWKPNFTSAGTEQSDDLYYEPTTDLPELTMYLTLYTTGGVRKVRGWVLENPGQATLGAAEFSPQDFNAETNNRKWRLRLDP